jgi:dTDP-glucose 4,6-dehydratase
VFKGRNFLQMNNAILITGGAGFIGSNFVRRWLQHENSSAVVLDSLTYAGVERNLAEIADTARLTFIHGDINDEPSLESIFRQYKPQAVVHFAAETHVDRSIVSPDLFIRTNVNGTFALLRQALNYYNAAGTAQHNFRFLHVSTDEVYGTLSRGDPPFCETTPYAPNSPYAASKAASDHFVRVYHRTFGLPTIITRSSNNYGPNQFPEKLIPLVTLNALDGNALPVYGDGLHVRDWLYVEDHCDAIRSVLKKGKPGESYNVGSGSEMTNIDVVKTICAILDELRPAHEPYASLIKHVEDRPGHDRRYAMNSTKLRSEMGWQPAHTFGSAIRKTVEWYVLNSDWVRHFRSSDHRSRVPIRPPGEKG